MKLLGWVHRKFRQNNGEVQKDFSIGVTGQPSVEDLQYYPNGNYCNKPFSKTQRDKYRRNSFTSLETSREEEEYREEERKLEFTEIFHDFLAIGTLGREPIITEPATTGFPISVDEIAEKETEVTENELSLINDELEKLLIADARDEGCNVSSGRNSHVSAGRNSHCSSIKIGGKPIEAAETYGNGTSFCPLQSYLLGSAIELQNKDKAVKKERRTSLGELFQNTKIQEENSENKSEKRQEKENFKSALYLMKKMLKKRLLHASSKNFTATCGGTIDSTTAEKKLRKMFSKKVHPECTFDQQSQQPEKNETMNINNHWTPPEHEIIWPSAEDITIYPEGRMSNKSTWSFKNQSHSSEFTQSTCDASGNEFWVKTDEDYLVLEL